MTIDHIIQLCGLAHIGLVAGSLALPKLLDWKAAFAGILVIGLARIYERFQVLPAPAQRNA